MYLRSLLGNIPIRRQRRSLDRLRLQRKGAEYVGEFIRGLPVYLRDDARYVTYDELIQQAQDCYREYLDAQRRAGKLAKSLDKIYAEFPS